MGGVLGALPGATDRVCVTCLAPWFLTQLGDIRRVGLVAPGCATQQMHVHGNELRWGGCCASDRCAVLQYFSVGG